eukprot:5928954-Amphidinium_carterae.1
MARPGRAARHHQAELQPHTVQPGCHQPLTASANQSTVAQHWDAVISILYSIVVPSFLCQEDLDTHYLF